MRSPLKRAAIALTLLTIVLLVASVTGRPVAGQELNHAGLVVRHGDGRITYAVVAFSEESISGIELIKRSGISVVTVSFGGLGEGVCSLESEGCPASECRQRVCQGPGGESPYWRYFRQAAPGNWQALALGASATKVRDGDIDGWSWTPEEANLPPVMMDDLLRTLGISSVNGTPQIESTAIHVTIYPEGASPPGEDDGQSAEVYVAAGVIVALIGLIGVVVARRGRMLGARSQ
jgi:hypothetical protein